MIPVTCVTPVVSLGPDWVYCEGFELTTVCLADWFNGWFELPSEYADRGPGPLKPADEGAGVVTVGLNGST